MDLGTFVMVLFQRSGKV
ncbi:rCG29639 [Rattus norvegicus]|uniref:RCG29639 n=1 Tax=Rattus norvegicus TaxID=10116 RepID=A6IMM0_RAT|nr:rCG29639 [Rattus norvegicus]